VDLAGLHARRGGVGIAAALAAGSVALLGFGLDSGIEALASVIVIWRFTGTRRLGENAERRAQRLVAVTFFVLAPYIAQDAIRTLIDGEHPNVSWVGIGLAVSSMIVMPLLGGPNSGSASGSRRARPPARQPEHALRLPRRGRPGRPGFERRVRAVVADPATAIAIAALAVREDVRHGLERTAAPPRRSPPASGRLLLSAAACTSGQRGPRRENLLRSRDAVAMACRGALRLPARVDHDSGRGIRSGVAAPDPVERVARPEPGGAPPRTWCSTSPRPPAGCCGSGASTAIGPPQVLVGTRRYSRHGAL